jgi:crotonobetainyl-CoA:carnitine CoA-transferase CaiB-like acyl-CoA transferase
LFRAADRPVVIAVGTDTQWQACATAIDLPRLATDPELVTNAGRIRNRERVVTAIAERVRELSAAELVRRLTAVAVPVGLVRSVREALGDVDASPLTGVSPAVPGSVRLPPPGLDEHGAQVRAQGWRAFDAQRDRIP